MCGGSAPPPQDNSAEVARIEAAEATRAREAETARKAEEKALFEGNLSTAYTTGIDSARNFFSEEGLDPDEYTNAIQSGANSAKSLVPNLDSSPGTYFSNLGSSVFDQLQSSERNRALRGIDTFARNGFATDRIGNEVDDPFLASILEEGFVGADDEIRRSLDRGVITQSGYGAALDDLTGQRTGANVRLQDIGLAELERGRGDLRDIASTGRTTASNLRLGDGFDPFSLEGDLNTSSADFFASLGDRLRANAPGDLFDTSGLLGIAGAAQGAQNTTFDPNGLLGAGEDEDEDEEKDEDEFVAF